MDQELKHFENNDFLAEASEQEGCRISVKVTIKPKTAQKAYQKAIKIVNKQISIPGFRKGHAPDKTVISRYGSYIEQEWKEILINEGYRAALDLTQIYPMNKEGIQRPKLESSSQEEGAIVRVVYEHYPHVPTIEFSKIQVPEIKAKEISEDEVNEVIEEVKRGNADWEDVAGRAVQEGDYVDVTIDSIEEETPKTIVQDRRFEISDKRLPAWIKKLLLGMQIAESVEGCSELDEDADEEMRKNFKPTKVRITLLAIKQILLPELNDQLAQKAGAESVEGLKKNIRNNLERSAEDERKEKLFDAVDNALLETYRFDLPLSVIASEKEERLSRKMEALKQEFSSEEEFKNKESELAGEVEQEIDRTLRLYFLNKQIAKQGQITLSNEELNDELVRYISQNPYLYGKEKDESAMRDLVSRMASVMMQRKAKEYALSQIAQ